MDFHVFLAHFSLKNGVLFGFVFPDPSRGDASSGYQTRGPSLQVCT